MLCIHDNIMLATFEAHHNRKGILRMNTALAHAQYIERTLPKLTKFEKCTSDKKSRPGDERRVKCDLRTDDD